MLVASDFDGCLHDFAADFVKTKGDSWVIKNIKTRAEKEQSKKIYTNHKNTFKNMMFKAALEHWAVQNLQREPMNET